jgi:hypothetical protein
MHQELSRPPRITFWNLVIASVCLCVFVLSLQAKLAQYEPPSPSVTAVKSAKLWIGGNRLERQDGLKLAPMGSLPIVLLFGLILPASSVQFVPLATPTPVALSNLWQLRRFFRPPPVL